METFFLIGLIALIAFLAGRTSQLPKIIKARAETKKAQTEIRSLQNRLWEVQGLFEETLRDIRNDSVLLPSLARWADNLQEAYDNDVVRALHTKKRPAHKAAEEVRLARAERRQIQKEFQIAVNRVDLYEALAPWLPQYTELSLGELIEGMKEDEEAKVLAEDGEDPVRRFIPQAEWDKFSPSERNQIALDRYCDPHRKRTPWFAGREYERFVGYEYERLGYQVKYQGALGGREDLGIDLICENEEHVLAIQCKRLSVEKQVPIRENVVAQVYGATKFHQMESGVSKKILPVLVTTYELSAVARYFANYLDVRTQEYFPLKPYPMIKCNISPTDGEKIYHLPMDQQYDRVVVGDHLGEFYAWTVEEAEAKGFRRAFRWRGNRSP